MTGTVGLVERARQMQRIGEVGFETPDQAKTYLEDKEVLLEELAAAISDLAAGSESQQEALKASMGELRRQLKDQRASSRCGAGGARNSATRGGSRTSAPTSGPTPRMCAGRRDGDSSRPGRRCRSRWATSRRTTST